MPQTVPSPDPAGLPDRMQLPLRFDAARMAAEVAAIPADDWIAHFVRQNYEGGWSIIPLRCKAGAKHPIMMAVSDPSATEFEDTPWLACAPYLREVLDSIPCALHSVRLMRLEPQSRIKPHSDVDLDAVTGTARLHVPITTNPQVDFRLNGTTVAMEPGTVWYLRLSDEHQVTNAGQDCRIHLVIDCAANDWLLGLLGAASLS